MAIDEINFLYWFSECRGLSKYVIFKKKHLWFYNYIILQKKTQNLLKWLNAISSCAHLIISIDSGQIILKLT